LVKEEIVLGHRISEKEIDVNYAMIETIEKLPPSTNVRREKLPRACRILSMIYQGFL